MRLAYLSERTEDEAKSMMTIAFICTANMCRSVMAQTICQAEAENRHRTLEILAGGTMNMTGCRPVEEVYETCALHGTPPRKEASTFVADLPLTEIDRFLVMDQRHATDLMERHGVAAERISLLGSFDPEPGAPVAIADPIGQDLAAFEACYVRLRRCIAEFLERTARDL